MNLLLILLPNVQLPDLGMETSCGWKKGTKTWQKEQEETELKAQVSKEIQSAP